MIIGHILFLITSVLVVSCELTVNSSTFRKSHLGTLDSTLTVSFLAGIQTVTVPTGTVAMTITASGGGGYILPYDFGPTSCQGGAGAVISVTLTVNVSTLYVLTGGQATSQDGGYNGGGSANSHGLGGGGATDVRTQPFNVSSRLVVAGGGGGCNPVVEGNINGGAGGLIEGEAGMPSGDTQGGGGGSQTAGGEGTGGGSSGSLGTGGSNTQFFTFGSGGGGGYYGGGSASMAGGGGGSSYPSNAALIGTNIGNGQATFTFYSSPIVMPTAFPTFSVTASPSVAPTTITPSLTPSLSPTLKPTPRPSLRPSPTPTAVPSAAPTGPTSQPSKETYDPINRQAVIALSATGAFSLVVVIFACCVFYSRSACCSFYDKTPPEVRESKSGVSFLAGRGGFETVSPYSGRVVTHYTSYERVNLTIGDVHNWRRVGPLLLLFITVWIALLSAKSPLCILDRTYVIFIICCSVLTFLTLCLCCATGWPWITTALFLMCAISTFFYHC